MTTQHTNTEATDIVDEAYDKGITHSIEVVK